MVDFVADVVTWLPAVGFAVDVTAVNACCCVVVDESVCSPGGLAENSQSHEISARDNLVLACNFAKYSPITNVFTDRLSNKPFLIWLLTTPPHLKHVATLPCNISLIACLMFHGVVWQYMQRVVSGVTRRPKPSPPSPFPTLSTLLGEHCSSPPHYNG